MKNCLAICTNDKFKNSFLDTNLITVGETSEEFQFYTLLSSPPSSLACETTDNTLSISWSDPTVGLVAGTDYTYSFSLMESMFSQYLPLKVLYMSFDNFLLAVESCDLSQADKSITGTPPLTLFFETLKNRVSRKPCC